MGRQRAGRGGTPDDDGNDAGAEAPDALTITLESGASATMQRDGDGWTLVVDGTPQSNVVPGDLRELAFGYIRHMGHVIDLAWPEGRPITAVHLGAGAMTIPRYVEETRPGSRQQVLELERGLVELVRKVAPLPRHAAIRLRYGDAREQLGRLPTGIAGTVDLVVVDIFAGPQTPAHVTSVEFFALLVPLLAPGGLVLVNIADGHELRFARGEAATLREVFVEVRFLADPGVAKGRRFGNFVGIASAAPREIEGLARRMAAEFPPTVVLEPNAVRDFAAGLPPVRDAAATPSPKPGRGVFTAKRTGGWS